MRYEILDWSNNSDGDLFREWFDGVPKKDNWKPLKLKHHYKGEYFDFPNGLLHVKCFSEKAKNILLSFIKDNVELLECKIGKRNIYLINVLKYLDVVDDKKSVTEKLISGKIYNYSKLFIDNHIVPPSNHIFSLYIKGTDNKILFRTIVSENFKNIDESLLTFDDGGLYGDHLIDIYFINESEITSIGLDG